MTIIEPPKGPGHFISRWRKEGPVDSATLSVWKEELAWPSWLSLAEAALFMDAPELLEAMHAEQGELDAFGAGGAQMKKAGVDLAIDLTAHAVVGIWEAICNYGKFRRFFNKLLDLAMERRPNAIVCIDNPGFNLRFVRAIRDGGSGA